jgi:fibrillarin-like pre-rRNA processing protein
MIKPHKLQGVYVMQGKKTTLVTRNLIPGKRVYGENLYSEKGIEYREWDVRKSKLGAGITKGIKQIGIKPGSRVLYLGCASGTTPSHVSDLVGKGGLIFALDFAPRVMRDMVFLCEERKNMIPLLANAKYPGTYLHRVLEVDAIFQDVAQKDQAKIFLDNCNVFLKQGGFGILCVKAKSIDVGAKPRHIFKAIQKELEQHLTLVEFRELDPFEKDHCLFMWKKK